MMKAITPIGMAFAPFLLRFVPVYASKFCVVSQSGQFLLMDTSGSTSTPPPFLHNIDLPPGAAISAFDVSNSSQALSFADDAGYVYLFGASSEILFNPNSQPTEFADEVRIKAKQTRVRGAKKCRGKGSKLDLPPNACLTWKDSMRIIHHSLFIFRFRDCHLYRSTTTRLPFPSFHLTLFHRSMKRIGRTFCPPSHLIGLRIPAKRYSGDHRFEWRRERDHHNGQSIPLT